MYVKGNCKREHYNVIVANPPVRHSATKTADKKDGGQFLVKGKGGSINSPNEYGR